MSSPHISSPYSAADTIAVTKAVPRNGRRRREHRMFMTGATGSDGVIDSSGDLRTMTDIRKCSLAGANGSSIEVTSSATKIGNQPGFRGGESEVRGGEFPAAPNKRGAAGLTSAGVERSGQWGIVRAKPGATSRARIFPRAFWSWPNRENVPRSDLARSNPVCTPMTYPKLHNAMWPGLVGKEPGTDHPPISLERMLELTANASVNGQRFEGVDLFLFHPHTDPDASDDAIRGMADLIASKGLAVGSLVAPVWPGTVGRRPWARPEDREKFVSAVQQGLPHRRHPQHSWRAAVTE